MDLIRDLARELDKRRELALEVIRMFLGVALLVRGVLFVTSPELLLAIGIVEEWAWPVMVGHYVAFAHLAGGLLLAIGLVTRVAALVQVPAAFGATFLVHWQEGLLAGGQSLELAGLTLFLLVVLAFYGGGRWSVDAWMQLRFAAQSEAAPAADRWAEAR